MDQERERLLGEAPAFLKVLDEVSRAAPLDKPILIVGERGTGKELIAARLHYLSNRWDAAYVTMNCAAISDTLLESELFGHEAGSFTGASRNHKGRFERAGGGSLFLDELATASLLVQEKILRVIEYGEFERVGGSKTLKTDVRLVAATNEDLPGLAQQGRFRRDLLDRLAFDVITLPPLRERENDILLLAEQFGINMASELEKEYFTGFSKTAQAVLLSYSWPGNVRELKNVVERCVYRHLDPHAAIQEIVLDPFDSPFRPGSNDVHSSHGGGDSATSAAGNTQRQPDLPLDLKQSVQEFETGLIRHALEEGKYNQKNAADLLGLTYHQLRGYLKKYRLLNGQGQGGEKDIEEKAIEFDEPE